MAEIYFKNPHRGKSAAQPKPFRSEKERLGVDVVEYPLRDPEEFEKMNKKIASEKRKTDQKKKTDDAAKEFIAKFRNGDISNQELEEELHKLYNFIPNQEVAAKPLINNGQNEELQWTKALDDKSSLETLEESLVVEEQTDDEPILAAEVPDVPESPFVEEENEGFGLDQVQLGEYVLLYKNSVLGIGSLKSIKNTLSSIMDGDDKLVIEDFVVMKRVPVKMGIFIDE